MKRPARSPAPQKQAGLAPRRAALGVLSDVLDRRRPLSEALDRLNAGREGQALADRDKSLARALAYTTLRQLGRIDAALGEWLQKPLPEGAGPTQHILRLALAEIGYLRTPAYAAGAVAMGLAGSDPEARHFRNLVNALVRRAGRELTPLLEGLPEEVALPAWLVQGWKRHYGAETTKAMIAALTAEPPLDITLKPGQEAAVWAERLNAEMLPTGSLRLRPGLLVDQLDGFAQGDWWVQDAAAALPARLLRPQPGEAIADLCAAPGGKTLQLAAAGADVTAVDLSADRLETLKANLARTGLAARCVAADALTWAPPQPPDAILLDAPCTATGTIRRHPDLPWIKDASDIRALAEVQRGLLLRAIDIVKPGGRILYSVCSLEPQEGDDLIKEVLDAAAGKARLDPITAADCPGIGPFLTSEGTVRTTPADWPDTGHIDGFFAARLSVG